MVRFSRWGRALSAAGFLASGFILGIAFFSLPNSAATLPLSQYIGTICATVLQSFARQRPQPPA
jgi:ABC-type Fe3+ transport system permease subunit